MRWAHALSTVLIAATLVLVSGDAFAKKGCRAGCGISVDFGTTFIPHVPTLHLSSKIPGADGAAVPGADSVLFPGTLTFDGKWGTRSYFIPIFGLSAGLGGGNDQTLFFPKARASLGSMQYFAVLLPGFGLHTDLDHGPRASFGMRGVWSSVTQVGTVSSGNLGEHSYASKSLGVGALADLSVCLDFIGERSGLCAFGQAQGLVDENAAFASVLTFGLRFESYQKLRD